jgi:hypothetical protein
MEKKLIYKKLHKAIFAAYVWKLDLSDEEFLEKLLALNLERENNSLSTRRRG